MTHRVREATTNGGEENGASYAVGRLLLVDDDNELRAVFSKALRLLGFAVDEEQTLQGALARIERTPYDCAVVDLGLPDGDGLAECTLSAAPSPERCRTSIPWIARPWRPDAARFPRQPMRLAR